MSKGSLWFKSGLDNTKLKRDTKEASDLISNMSAKTVSDSKKMEDSFSGVGKALALVGGTAAIGLLGKQILDTTAKFEKFGIVLRNSLGDTRGNASLDMIAEFAATTPFQLDEVTASFVKMANQGFVPTREEMVKLGDVASSTGKSFDQLTEALLDAQTGQFERLKEFGIKASSQGDKVTFSFKEQLTTVDNTNTAIQKYILSLGDLKGIAGANALISESLTGQLSNLEDKLSMMFNTIGSANKGFLYEAVGGVSTLIENYETVGKVLVGLIATYGAYKVALIIATSTSKGYTLAQVIQYNALLLTEKAQLALNKSMLMNPYVAVTMAVVALSAGIYALATSTSDAQKAHEKLQETVDETNISIAAEQVQIDTLFARLNAAKKGTEEYEAAKDAIFSKYGNYLEKLGDENTALNNVALAYETISAAAEKAAKARGLEAATKQAADDLVNKQADINKDLKELLDDKYGKDSKKTLDTFYQLKKIVELGQGTDSVASDLLAQFDVKESLGYRSDGTEMYYISNELKSLIENGKEAKRIFNDVNKQAMLMFGNNPTSKTNNEGDKKTENGIDYVFRNGKWEVVKVQETPAQKKKREDAERKEKVEADRKIADYEKAKQEALKNLNAEELALLRSKTSDKKALIEIDYQETLKAIKEEEDLYKSAAALAGDKNPDLSKFSTRRTVAFDQRNFDFSQVDKEEKDALLSKYKSFLDEKLELDKEYQEDLQKLEGVGASQDKLDEAIKSYNQKLSRLSKEVFDSLKKDNDSFKKLFGDTSNFTKKQLEDVIATGEQIKIVAETGNMDIAASLGLTETDVALLMANKDNVIQVLNEIIDKKEQLYSDSGTFGKIAMDWENLKKSIASKDTKGINDSLENIRNGASNITSSVRDLTIQIRELAELSGNEGLANAASKIEEATGIMEQIQTGASVGGQSGGWIGTIIGAVIGNIVGVLSVILNRKKQVLEANKEIAESVKKIAYEYELLQFQQKAAGEQYTSIFGTDDYAKAMNSLQAYREALAAVGGTKTRNGFTTTVSAEERLSGISVKTKDKVKHLLRPDEEAEYKSILELYPDLISATGEFNKAKAQLVLTDKRLSKSQAQTLQEMIDYTTEAENALADFTSYVSNLFGSMSNDITDSFVDAFRNGTDAAKTMTERVASMMEGLYTDMLTSVIIKPTIEKYTDEFTKAIATSNPDDEAALASSMISELSAKQEEINALLQIYQDAAKEQGISIFDDTKERTGSSRGITTASQDTVDELNGRFTVIQSHTYEINQSIKMLQSNSNAILLNVQGIKTNTDKLHDMEISLSGIKTAINSINDKGITLRG